MKLLINSNIYGHSGYAKSLRELGVALRKSGIEVSTTHPNPNNLYIGEKHRCLLSEQVELRRGDSLLFRPYFEPSPSVAEGIHKIGFIALESTRLPERMVRDCNQDSISQVWVPSNHCKKYAIESGIIEDKIRVVPHGYDPKIFMLPSRRAKVPQQGGRVAEEREATPFKFIFVGGYTGRGDRKGADILCQAFHGEFKPKEKVELLMKINTTYGPFPAHDLAIDPRIKFNTEQVLDSKMPDFYNEGDCFVFPTWGEAFGMTLLEAMACGLPAITNTWSGENDYISKLNDGRVKNIELGYRVPARYTPWDCGEWRKPDINNLRKRMRQMFESKPKKKKYRGIERWTWGRAAAQAKKCLEEL